MTSADVAQWIFDQLQQGVVYPGELAYVIAKQFGKEYVTQTAGGHLTI